MVQDFYDGIYKAMFYSQGRATRATKLLHKGLERIPNKKKWSFPVTLEVGGGEGLHFEYVKSNYSHYILTDIRGSELCESAENARISGLLSFEIQNAEQLSFGESTIDRVIFACVLHHLNDPERALEEARRVLKSGGIVSIYLPCDPGFLYRNLRLFFTGSRARKLGLDYELYNVRQHINHYYQLKKLIGHVFRDDIFYEKRFPFPFVSYDLNIYSVFHITKV